MARIEIQEKFDGAFAAVGLGQAPPALARESESTYTRRLIETLQPYSPTWGGVDIYGLHADALPEIERGVIAETLAAGGDQSRGDWSDPGALREIRAGNIVEFAGDPMTWLSHFAAPARAVKKFMDGAGRTIRVNRGTIR